MLYFDNIFEQTDDENKCYFSDQKCFFCFFVLLIQVQIFHAYIQFRSQITKYGGTLTILMYRPTQKLGLCLNGAIYVYIYKSDFSTPESHESDIISGSNADGCVSFVCLGL